MAILTEYIRPATVAEAEQLLRRGGAGAAILAGGTQLVADLERRTHPQIEVVIDIGRLGLADLRVWGSHLRAGAAASVTSLIEHEAAAQLAGGLLVRAARGEGPVNLRNAMTLGGLVAAAQGDSELYGALLALGVTLVATGAAEPLPLARYEPAHGLITELLIPLDDLRSGLARVARTPADRPIVAAIAATGTAGTRVVLCGVAARPILDGTAYTPFADFKGSAEYRQAMASVLKRRALAEASGGPAHP